MKIRLRKEGYVPIDGESFPTPNGNYARSHKQNVIRRRMRRLKNKAKQAS